MRGTYQGLPPAKNVEQAIILAQRLILKDLERLRERASSGPDGADRAIRPAA